MCIENQNIDEFYASLNIAEEFIAAIEAGDGQTCSCNWKDPMDGAAVKEAFEVLLMTKRPDRGLDILVRCNVMEHIFPEVFAMVDFGEGVRHKDVWEHTKKVILRSPRKLDLRWAALFHDIGKVPTRRFGANNIVTFIGHPQVGARMFKKIAKRIPWSKDSFTRIEFLISSHLRASAYDETWTDSAVRRFINNVGEYLDDLLNLSRADITSKYVEKVRRGTDLINLLEKRVAELKERDAKPQLLPKGLGTVLIERFNISPGPILGSIMKRLANDAEEGLISIGQPFDHYMDYIEQHPDIINNKK